MTIYLDNAATSFPKPECVYQALDAFARTHLANPGRAGHKMALAAERAALLKQANEKLDVVIDMFARIVALTDARAEAKQINGDVRQNLESYYKYRHKSLDGMQELINKYKK